MEVDSKACCNYKWTFLEEAFFSSIQTPNIRSARSNAPIVSYEEPNLEDHVAKMAFDLLDVAKNDYFLLKHSIVDLHVLQGKKKKTIDAQIEHRVVDPS